VYTPEHKGTRQHFQIFSPVQLTLNVLGTALGTFNLTVPAASWVTIDFPDGAQYQLDTSMSMNVQTIYVRETAASVV
jgi:hypothetical protein